MSAALSRRGVLAAIGCGAVASLVAPLQAASIEKIKGAGVLKIGVYRDFEPWAWDQGGSFRGIDVDLGKAIAAKLGVRAQVLDFLAGEDVDDDLRNIVWKGPPTGGLLADVMMHVPYDRTFALRNDRAVIVAPYYREGFAIACDRDTDCEVPTPQFAGKRLTAELNSIPDIYLTGSFGGVLRSGVSHLPSGMAALDAVRARNADVAMATRAEVEHAIALDKERLVARKGPIGGLTSPGWDVALAVKDDSRDLGDRLETMMPEMLRDGTVAKIFASYGVAPRPPIAS